MTSDTPLDPPSPVPEPSEQAAPTKHLVVDAFVPIAFNAGLSTGAVKQGAVTAQGAASMSATAGITARASVLTAGRGTLTVLPADWAAEREELLSRIGAVEELLHQIATLVQASHEMAARRDRGGIGGNNPPESIDAPPIDLELVAATLMAARLARTEVQAQSPRWDVLKLCAGLFGVAARALSALSRWVLAKGNLFTEELVKSTANALGKAIGAAALLQLLDHAGGDLSHLEARIVHVLTVIGFH